MTSAMILTLLLLLVSFSTQTREASQEDLDGKDFFFIADVEVQNGTRLLEDVLGITLRMKTNLRQFVISTKDGPDLHCCGHEMNETLKSICLSTADECVMHIDHTESEIKQWIKVESGPAVRRAPLELGKSETYRKILEDQRTLMGKALDSIICTFNVSKHFIRLFEELSCYPAINTVNEREETVQLFREVDPLARGLLRLLTINGEQRQVEGVDRYINRGLQYLKEIFHFYKWLVTREEMFSWSDDEPFETNMGLTLKASNTSNQTSSGLEKY